MDITPLCARPPVVATDTEVGAEPKISLSVHPDRMHLVVDQAIGLGKGGQLHPVETEDSLYPGGAPQLAPIIGDNGR